MLCKLLLCFYSTTRCECSKLCAASYQCTEISSAPIQEQKIGVVSMETLQLKLFIQIDAALKNYESMRLYLKLGPRIRNSLKIFIKKEKKQANLTKEKKSYGVVGTVTLLSLLRLVSWKVLTANAGRKQNDSNIRYSRFPYIYI